MDNQLDISDDNSTDAALEVGGTVTSDIDAVGDTDVLQLQSKLARQ